MNLNAAMLRLLAEKGLTLDEIIEFAELNETPADRTGAERQARYRERRDVSADEWEAIRHRIFERDNHQCTYCGATENIVCDHVVPLIQGGRSTDDNLTTACKPCNSSKAGRSPDEWLGVPQ